uniref:coiled-coil domain-containing protein 122 isoform X2 n=1 Tax=Myxine glutinosa TaxID=7769 RepID=UPI00358EE43C
MFNKKVMNPLPLPPIPSSPLPLPLPGTPASVKYSILISDRMYVFLQEMLCEVQARCKGLQQVVVCMERRLWPVQRQNAEAKLSFMQAERRVDVLLSSLCEVQQDVAATQDKREEFEQKREICQRKMAAVREATSQHEANDEISQQLAALKQKAWELCGEKAEFLDAWPSGEEPRPDQLTRMQLEQLQNEKIAKLMAMSEARKQQEHIKKDIVVEHKRCEAVLRRLRRQVAEARSNSKLQYIGQEGAQAVQSTNLSAVDQ